MSSQYEAELREAVELAARAKELLDEVVPREPGSSDRARWHAAVQISEGVLNRRPIEAEIKKRVARWVELTKKQDDLRKLRHGNRTGAGQ